MATLSPSLEASKHVSETKESSLEIKEDVPKKEVVSTAVAVFTHTKEEHEKVGAHCFIQRATYGFIEDARAQDVTEFVRKHLVDDTATKTLRFGRSVSSPVPEETKGGSVKVLCIFLKDKTQYHVRQYGRQWLTSFVFSYLNIDVAQTSGQPETKEIKFLVPRTLAKYPNGVIEIEMHGGLSNQIYSFINGVWIARITGRALLLPNLLVRKTALDPVCELSGRLEAIKRGLLSHWTRLFDLESIQHVSARLGVTLIDNGYVNHECAAFPGKTAFAENWCRIGLANAMGKIDVNELKRALKSYNCLYLISPMFGTPPKDYAEFRFRLDLIRAIVPNTRLQALSRSVITALQHFTTEQQKGDTAAQLSSSDKPLWCVHYRCEDDWKKSASALTFGVSDICDVVKRCIPIGAMVLFIGEVHDGIMLNVKRICKDYTIMNKNQFFRHLDDEKLCFEEAAVLDRSLALYCDGFIGQNQSTFSILIALDFDFQQKPYYFYGIPFGGNCIENLLMTRQCQAMHSSILRM